jgi:hypothetical protein
MVLISGSFNGGQGKVVLISTGPTFPAGGQSCRFVFCSKLANRGVLAGTTTEVPRGYYGHQYYRHYVGSMLPRGGLKIGT